MGLSQYDREHFEDVMRTGTWFTAHLFRLILRADIDNLALLRLAFPDEVALVEAWQRGDMPVERSTDG